MTATRRATGQSIPPISEIKHGEDTSTKPGTFKERIPFAKPPNTLHQPTQQKEDNTLKQPEDTPTEHVVKREDDPLLATDHNNKGPENKTIGVAEAQDAQKRDHGQSFETLEKGIIYFFYRSRVDIPSARGINDVARSFIVLRPSPQGAALDQQEGSSKFGKNFRLLVVPKKALPSSSRMKEMGFVEKAGITLQELQETFIAEVNYETQTYGSRTMPEARMYAKGVYSFASTQHGSYLAYILTDPKNIGSVQEDFGLQVQGKWLVQSKNPKVFSPPSVSLPNNPSYPKSFDEIFGDHRWVPLQPKLIDYPSAQFLLIGQPVRKDFSIVLDLKHEDTDIPDKQLYELAHWCKETENHSRGVDSIYGDLGLEVHHHPKVSTVWNH